MAKYRKKPIEIEAIQFIIWDFNNIPQYTEIFDCKYSIKGQGYKRYIELPTL